MTPVELTPHPDRGRPTWAVTLPAQSCLFVQDQYWITHWHVGTGSSLTLELSFSPSVISSNLPQTHNLRRAQTHGLPQGFGPGGFCLKPSLVNYGLPFLLSCRYMQGTLKFHRDKYFQISSSTGRLTLSFGDNAEDSFSLYTIQF